LPCKPSVANTGGSAMTDYLIAGILFVAMVTTLVYLWKRERG
jgi:LPXTG-motif cell wall-anchored protein